MRSWTFTLALAKEMAASEGTPRSSAEAGDVRRGPPTDARANPLNAKVFDRWGKAGKFPAMLAPHGHAAYGRLEHGDVFSVPSRGTNLIMPVKGYGWVDGSRYHWESVRSRAGITRARRILTQDC